VASEARWQRCCASRAHGQRGLQRHSFNGLGAVSPGDPQIGKPLIRVDLRTGALEQIETPGFSATLSDNIIGQTRSRLYVTINGEGLVAIDKP
jgi:hypothetical protein